jgi:hypothetical protein
MSGFDMQADKAKCCKHFAPSFPETGDAQVDSSLTHASELNMAFAFKKTGESPAVARSTPAVARTTPAVAKSTPGDWPNMPRVQILLACARCRILDLVCEMESVCNEL